MPRKVYDVLQGIFIPVSLRIGLSLSEKISQPFSAGGRTRHAGKSAITPSG